MPNDAPIADIRRLTIHDGPGTRDTVFVKGCPLRCLWCHNPESISRYPQLLFHARLCIQCGKCKTVCPGGVHKFESGNHLLNRSGCSLCGACEEVCYTNALRLCGKTRKTAEEVFNDLLPDRDFFEQSGGGVTVSGGEALLYPEFTSRLFELLHKEKIATALDTCGAVSWGAFETVLPFTDLVLFDIKGMDPVMHERNTGMGNERIHQNLRELGKRNIPVEIRIPVIPNYNDSEKEIEEAGKFLREIPSIVRVRLLAYHSMARDKYRFAGMKDTMPDVPSPSADALQKDAALLKKYLSAEIIVPGK